MYGIDLFRLPIHTSLISFRKFNEMNCRERALRRYPPGCVIPRRYKAKAPLFPLHFSAAEIKGGFFSASAIKRGFIHLPLGSLSPSSARSFSCSRFPGARKHKRWDRHRVDAEISTSTCNSKGCTRMRSPEVWAGTKRIKHEHTGQRGGGGQGRQQARRCSFWLLACLMRMLLKERRLKMGWHAGTKYLCGVFYSPPARCRHSDPHREHCIRQLRVKP